MFILFFFNGTLGLWVCLFVCLFNSPEEFSAFLLLWVIKQCQPQEEQAQWPGLSGGLATAALPAATEGLRPPGQGKRQGCEAGVLQQSIMQP